MGISVSTFHLLEMLYRLLWKTFNFTYPKWVTLLGQHFCILVVQITNLTSIRKIVIEVFGRSTITESKFLVVAYLSSFQ